MIQNLMQHLQFSSLLYDITLRNFDLTVHRQRGGGLSFESNWYRKYYNLPLPIDIKRKLFKSRNYYTDH